MGQGRGTSLFAPNRKVSSATKSIRRWLVVVSSTVIFILAAGLMSINGMLYMKLEETHNISMFKLSWIGSIMSGLMNVGGLAAGYLASHLGCRVTGVAGGIISSTGYLASMTTSNVYVLYVTLGILPGFGLSLAMVSSLVCLNQCFVKLRPLVMAITLSGSGVGVVVFPIVTTYFLEAFGLKGTFLMLGGFLLNIICCVLIFRPVTATHDEFPVDEAFGSGHEETPSRMVDSNPNKPFSIVKLVVYMLTILLQSAGFYIHIMFIVEFMSQTIPNLMPQNAAFALSGNGIGNVLGHLLAGALSHMKPKMMIQLKTFTLCVCGISSTGVIMCKSFLTMAMVVGLQGLSVGAYDSVQYEVLIRLVGPQRFSQFVGPLLVTQGAGGFIGPPLAVWLSSVTGARETPFFISGVCFVLSGLFLLPLLIVKSSGTGNSIVRDEHGKCAQQHQNTENIATITNLYQDNPFR